MATLLRRDYLDSFLRDARQSLQSEIDTRQSRSVINDAPKGSTPDSWTRVPIASAEGQASPTELAALADSLTNLLAAERQQAADPAVRALQRRSGERRGGFVQLSDRDAQRLATAQGLLSGAGTAPSQALRVTGEPAQPLPFVRTTGEVRDWIAVVGSRQAPEAANRMLYDAAHQLGTKAGYGVQSGGAQGPDAYGEQAALNALGPAGARIFLPWNSEASRSTPGAPVGVPSTSTPPSSATTRSPDASPRKCAAHRSPKWRMPVASPSWPPGTSIRCSARTSMLR